MVIRVDIKHIIEHKLPSYHGILGWETPYMDVSTTLHRHSCYSWRFVEIRGFYIFRALS